MTLAAFLKKLYEAPETIEFEDAIKLIDQLYSYTPTAFRNGELQNLAGENQGSCKLLSFAKLHDLDEQSTLACFGRYYRDEVLAKPTADSHQNIRNFIQTGWDGIEFDHPALKEK
jgi:hypothetical protein